MNRLTTCVLLSLSLSACGDDVQPVADLTAPPDLALPPDLVAPADLTPVVVDMAAAIIASSTFDTSVDGWKLYPVPATGPFEFVGGSVTPIYHSSGGASGAYVGAKSVLPSDILYWEAPMPYVGDKARMNNGQLRFSKKATSASMPFDAPEVVLKGNGMVLVFPPLKEPAVTWTDYFVAFNAAAGWKKTSLTGMAPTEEEFKGVLGKLEQLRIRAEHFQTKQEVGLDSVLMMTAPGM